MRILVAKAHQVVRSQQSVFVGVGRVLVVSMLFLVQGVLAATPQDVAEKWHTPFGLYLTPLEAFEMKQADPDNVTLIDIRTRAEVKYIGMADAVDANIPLRFLREDYAWSEKSSTYRTSSNPDFVAAVDVLLRKRGLDRDSSIILMCQSGSRVPVKTPVELTDALSTALGICITASFCRMEPACCFQS